MKRRAPIILGLLLNLTVPLVANATWYNPTWSYRQAIVITNGSEAVNDYAVSVVLTSPGFEFSQAAADGSDLRFADSDGTTALSYWIQEYDAAAGQAKVWVRIPSLSVNESRTIYVYFGNPGATPASNGAATFPSFVDFSQNFAVEAPTLTANLSKIVRAPELPAPIIAAGAVGEYDHWGFREHGNVLYEPNEPDSSRRYKTWYSVYADSVYSDRTSWLAEAISPDGYTWTKYGRVSLTIRGEDPWVVHMGDTYYLYYEGKLDSVWDTVSLMTSPDGLTWSYYGIVVPPDSSLDWMNRSPSSPTVWVEKGPTDTTWYCYFEGKGTGTNRGGGSIGLATSSDGLNYTVYGTTPIIELGNPGDWDSAAMVPDCLYKEGNLYWLIYHGHNGITPFRAGFAYSTDLIHWTKAPAISGNPAVSEAGDPQFFWDANGQLTATICLTQIYRAYPVHRDSTFWPYTPSWTLESRGGNFGWANSQNGLLQLSGEPFREASTSFVTTQRFTNGFSVEMRERCRDYGGRVFNTIAVGSGDIVDMNTGGQGQWETTALQSGYVAWNSNHGVLARMPATGGKTVFSFWGPSAVINDFYIQRLVYDRTGLLKWYVADTLRASAQDTSFMSNQKRVLVSQGELTSGDGGIQDIDWVLVRKQTNFEPVAALGEEEVECSELVTVPNGGESWFLGIPNVIQWTGGSSGAHVNIELNRHYPIGAWELLAGNVPNDGRDTLTIGGVPSDSCRLRISCIAPACGDTSDANFTLLASDNVMVFPAVCRAVNGCTNSFNLYVVAVDPAIQNFQIRYHYDSTILQFAGSSAVPLPGLFMSPPVAANDTLALDGYFVPPGSSQVDTLIQLSFQVLSTQDTTVSFQYESGTGTQGVDSTQSISFTGSSSVIEVDAALPLTPSQITIGLRPAPADSLDLWWPAVTHDVQGDTVIAPIYSVYFHNITTGDEFLVGTTSDTHLTDALVHGQDSSPAVHGEYFVRACKSGS